MTTTFEYRPDYALPPGETLRDTLEALEMSQADLARRAGLSTKHVNQIIQGVVALTPDTAVALEHVTGVPARLWIALEANYRQRLARHQAQDLATEDREWLRSIPVKALVERDLIPRELDEGRRFEAVLRFFGVASRGAWESVWIAPAASFRQSKAFASQPGATAAWLRIGELDAAKLKTAPFDRARFREALTEIRTVIRKDPSHSIATATALCRDAGVAFVVIPEIPGARANGAARWLSPSKALVQLSLRHSWEDTFWFSFFHECGHLWLHGKRDAFVDDSERGNVLEDEADAFAAAALIPRSFERDLATISTLAEVQAFARKAHVPPGVVVGRLQTEGRLPRDVGNRFRHRLRLSADGGVERI